MTIRRAGPADADAVADLVNAAFEVEKFFVRGGRTSQAEVREALRTGDYLLVEEDGVLAGCVYVEVRGQRGYFGVLAVRPDRQRGGLGRKLVALAEEHCRAAGCTFVDIRIVNLRSELPPYYRSLGYSESGTLPWPAEVADKLLRPAWFVQMTKPL